MVIHLLINLASVRCNTTTLVIRGSPCGIPIIATNTTQPSLCPTYPTPSSSYNTLPLSYSSHQESGMNPISGASFFMMYGYGSLGYWSHYTVHSSSYRRNDDNEISEEEGLEVSSGDKRRGDRSLENSQSFSLHRGLYVGRGGSRSQDTIHS